MNIVNLIHIGEKEIRMDTLSREEKKEIWQKLNEQALRTIGYQRKEAAG